MIFIGNISRDYLHFFGARFWYVIRLQYWDSFIIEQASCPAVQWSSGSVVWMSGGLVVRWSGGLAVRWTVGGVSALTSTVYVEYLYMFRRRLLATPVVAGTERLEGCSGGGVEFAGTTVIIMNRF